MSKKDRNLSDHKNKKKTLLSILLFVGILVVMLVEGAVPVVLLLRYAALFVLNVGAAVVINRTSVLKKKLWYLVTLVCFVMLFFLGRLF